MKFLESIDIYDEHTLFNLIDGQGKIHHDIIIRGETITTLGKTREVHGSIGIICSTIINLGELTYVKGDFWLTTDCKNLLSLGKLQSVEGDVSLRYSGVSNLNNLNRIKTIIGEISIP